MSVIHKFGRQGEHEAELFLLKIGYKIIEKNFRSKSGEIDIIARENDTLVFVEVKTRSSSFWGQPVESITKKKLRSMINTSMFYIISHKIKMPKIRLDAIEIIHENNEFKVNHIKNITL